MFFFDSALLCCHKRSIKQTSSSWDISVTNHLLANTLIFNIECYFKWRTGVCVIVSNIIPCRWRTNDDVLDFGLIHSVPYHDLDYLTITCNDTLTWLDTSTNNIVVCRHEHAVAHINSRAFINMILSTLDVIICK